MVYWFSRGFKWVYVNRVHKSKSLIALLNKGVLRVNWDFVTFDKSAFFKIKIVHFLRSKWLFKTKIEVNFLLEADFLRPQIFSTITLFYIFLKHFYFRSHTLFWSTLKKINPSLSKLMVTLPKIKPKLLFFSIVQNFTKNQPLRVLSSINKKHLQFYSTTTL